MSGHALRSVEASEVQSSEPQQRRVQREGSTMRTARKGADFDVVLPDKDAGGGEGVRGLMRAVLLDAIMCMRGRVGQPQERARLISEARRWMMSTVRTWPFSFESICDVLGLSAPYLRRTLLRSVTSCAGEGPADAEAADDMVRRLSVLRMRGNQITQVVATRQCGRRKSRGR
jgi:hypothetical protein